MKPTPWFLGACAFASIAGAVGGATTNTTPIQNAGIGMEMLPERPIAFDRADSGIPEVAPPDHYPMTTPYGRVEVAELSSRGLYAQQRFGWQTARYAPLPEPPLVEEPAAEDRWIGADRAPPELEASPLAAPLEPLELAPPPAGEAGQHRMIDVAATLPGDQG
ncbi:hypothetical protein N0B51_12710 [Tsuneonella sp. YG55]|uniref:Uncharacterized protein n=1 Tax=Tsuneonella litorea TaxID=2976475 RepID=A0A9X2W2M4_9SPHN|nr:hypothetical protein [Tsuneonella litorea]MCT2559838.1 hypothetical protein [Tsuneonella litorea]